MDEPLWKPDSARREQANLTRFVAAVRARRGLEFPDYASLHRWSIERPDEFWFELAHFGDVKATWGEGPVLRHGDRMPGAEWFVGTRLNYAENLLHYHDDHPALIAWTEQGRRGALSYRQLHAEVGRVAAGLRAAGVVAGDRVAGFLPNLPESIVAMLAATSLGAIWTSCSPDFGLTGVLDRFGQVRPKVLFTADGYVYAGKQIDSLDTVTQLLAAIESVTTVVVIPHLTPAPDLARLAAHRVTHWNEFGVPGAKLVFERFPFAHPLFVMYSSGTTGVPKCIVHGAGGTLLQHIKEHQLHCDLRRDDRLFFFTTCGWMMWNWLASGLASGATLLLYDGSPTHPDIDQLWRMAESEHVSLFGTSPKYLASLQKSAFVPRERCTLPALRTVLSTGSPLPPEAFEFVYRDIKPDVHLASISGGTDIISCFCLGVPTLPVHAGEIQRAGLGMATDVVDVEGHSLPSGEQGELVCRRPFPSMPIGFWDDADQRRYRAAYFEHFPGLWHHGDYASRTLRDGFVIHGRSDAVLNPGGVRIGTAEIYRQVDALPDVQESICIGQAWQGDVRVVLFVKLRDGRSLDDALRTRIREAIRRHTTPRHVPAKILEVAEIPRTRSGKLVELAVRDVVHGREVVNTEAIANPAALEHFRNRTELAS